MQTDRYGNALTTDSDAARDAYVAGVDCLLTATAGGEESLQRALDADPQFALAHAALARELFLRADVKRAREGAARARELAQSVTPREQSHVNALALTIEGKPVESLAATRAHLDDHPRDAMVLAPACGVFGLIGFSGRQRREEELYGFLQRLAPHYGDDGWFNSMLAFAACETGRLDEALRRIDAAMAAMPNNAHGAHIMVHVLHELGEPAHALAFLDGWMPGFDRRGLLHCHLSWHVALAALTLGRLDRAWDAYLSGVHPGGAWGPPINVATDAPAFLWRSELAGHVRRVDLWRDVHGYVQQSFPNAGLPFIDLHRAVACAASGDFDSLDRLIGEMRERITAGRYPGGEVTALLAEGFAAYARGDWNGAIERFDKALPHTVRIGGSRAQRDLVEFTLMAAYLKAGRADEARGIVAHRVERRAIVTVDGWGQGSNPE